MGSYGNPLASAPISTPPGTGGNSMTNFLQSVEGALTQGGQASFGTGQQAFRSGINDFGPALNYWNEILSGNKSQMESAIAPEKSDILSQYRARRRQLAQTGSRSGGTNEATAQSEYSQAGDVAGLLQKLRPQAADKSAEIAGKIANLGLGESNLGLSAINDAISAALSQRGQNVQQQGQEFGLTESLISALI
jgi:hypothetical protein